MDHPSIEYLNSILLYDPSTGLLTWKSRPLEMFKQGVGRVRACSSWNSKYAGKPAFTAKSHGYHVGTVNGKTLRSHRVIWAIMTDSWPDEIDHEDGNRSNNTWQNLKDVNRHKNSKNQKKRIDNKSGAVGVRFHRGSWQAYGTKNGAYKHIGVYESFHDAKIARSKWERDNKFHQNHGRS